MENKTVEFDSSEQLSSIFGSFDENIKQIQNQFDVHIMVNHSGVAVSGSKANVDLAVRTIETLKDMFNSKLPITPMTIEQAIDLVIDNKESKATDYLKDVITITSRGKPIKCRTYGQREYINSIKENTVTICIGPAGTGKTYLAVAMAVNALKNKQVSRIVLTRPVVEAGERLGFLPGDLESKVDPYLRPLYDALFEMMGPENFQRNKEAGVVEIAPLAYMRGRTLSESCVILDEGQNAGIEQMKMFLTRFGEGSKVIITGDATQIDLPKERVSGLAKIAEILKDVNDIGIVWLTNKDVVRHKLVKDIVKAFERYEKKSGKTVDKKVD